MTTGRITLGKKISSRIQQYLVQDQTADEFLDIILDYHDENIKKTLRKFKRL